MYLTAVFRTLDVPDIISNYSFASGGVWQSGIKIYCHRTILYFLSIAFLAFFISPAIAQRNDDFIAAIGRVKSSIAAVACLAPSRPLSVHGSAFFVEENGTFLTAGHVIKEFLPSGALYMCQAGVYVPADSWQADQRGQLNARFMPFLPEQCTFDGLVDIAKCRTVIDPRADNDVHSKPSAVAWETQVVPDGTAVAFTGFPLSALIPYTSRANIVAYPLPPKPGATHIFLDKTAWPGASGSPVYISNGNVVGLIIQRGEGAASGLAVACDSQAIGRFLRTEHQHGS